MMSMMTYWMYKSWGYPMMETTTMDDYNWKQKSTMKKWEKKMKKTK